ncbi:hypothetical protein ACLBX9_03250 [Methylobacterium sp. A49B]
MTTEPEALMDPYEALRIIEVFVRVAEEADNPDAAPMILRQIQNVLDKALPRKARRRRRP